MYILFDYKKEPMTDIPVNDQVYEAIKKFYSADIESIRNLAEVATKLQT